jgi:hypothetical protein
MHLPVTHPNTKEPAIFAYSNGRAGGVSVRS